jgi:hypothetical protein
MCIYIFSGGEDGLADEGVVEDEGEGDVLEWSVGAVPQVQRKRVSAGTLHAELKHVVALTKPVACSAKECQQARYMLN